MDAALTNEHRAILWAAIEGDAGLWDLEWELNTLNGERLTNRADAREIVNDLLTRGLVTISVADGGSSPVPLSAPEARHVLDREDAWEPKGPDDTGVVRVNATEGGAISWSGPS